MSIIMTRENLPSDPIFSGPSPVTWHVALWILFSLALNSMAQPSGRLCGASSRYRTYLCSCPFLCFADGLSFLVRVIAASVYLRISPTKSSRLAIISRGDERHHTKRVKDSCFDEDLSESETDYTAVHTAAWPRWILFVVGTLPSAIKLASFSGLPTTQTLGLMFFASFLMIELLNFLSTYEEESTSMAEVLGYNRTDQPIDDQEVRSKFHKITVGLEWFESTMFFVSLFAHIGLLIVLSIKFWLANIPFGVAMVSTVHLLITSFTGLMTIAVIVHRVAGCFCSWLDRYVSMKQLTSLWLKSCFVTILLPRSNSHLRRMPQQKLSFIDLFNYISSVWFLYFALFFACRQLSLRVCDRWPVIAQWLLIDRRSWDSEKMEHLPARERTGTENETGVVHGRAITCLSIFLYNVAICPLWYAFVYDSNGTINPSWTEIFG